MIQILLKFFISVVCILVLIPKQKVDASSNFTTDYHVIYSVADNGMTRAELNIGLTNTSSEYYASSYKVQVGFDNITNITASDSSGKIEPEIEKNENGHIIRLKFNEKVVGLGKKLNFRLSFDTPDVGKKYGKIWEINIPGIADPEAFDKFTVEVKVPPSFGKPAFIKPAQSDDSLIFTKSQLGKSGISIGFGDKQIYAFQLIYHLKNDNIYPIKTEIALPPTTNYQNIFIQNINPQPENVIMDKDKNWLAEFSLSPSEKIDVEVIGKTEVFLTPIRTEELSERERLSNLEEKPFWQTKSEEIKQLADTLKTPEAIYTYVINTLKYDFSRVTDNKERLGALKSLQNPNSAVCLEYTDLFIAIARAAGIPAREIEGFAYTENSRQRPLSLVKDILHAWPEYYDAKKKTWIMIDPTWGATTGGVDYFSTLDFDHLAFVIKGADSNYPIPAGGYKFLSGKNTKDVSVDFSQNTPQEESNFEITSLLPLSSMSGFPITGKIKVKNNSQNLTPPQVLGIMSQDLYPRKQALKIPAIPPFGFTEVNVSFEPQPFLTYEIKSFKIRLNDQETTKYIDFSPLLIKKWWISGGGIGIGIFCIIIFIFAIKGRRL